MAFLAEALARIVLTYVVPDATMVVINHTVPYVVLTALIAGTAIYGRRVGAAARNRHAAEAMC